MIHKVCDALCLDTAGTDGPTSEFSKVVSVEGMNAVQAELVIYAYTSGTNALSIYTQVSNDGTNWQNLDPTAQTLDGIGRKLLNAETSVAASLVRLYFSLGGSGKAVLDAHVAVSSQ
ncbi:MAG: hypothetical protein AAF628_16010 [Planctomycetota bacterium]